MRQRCTSGTTIRAQRACTRLHPCCCVIYRRLSTACPQTPGSLRLISVRSTSSASNPLLFYEPQPLTTPANPRLFNSSSRLRRLSWSSSLVPSFQASFILLAVFPQLEQLSLTSSKPSDIFLMILLFATALLLDLISV